MIGDDRRGMAVRLAVLKGRRRRHARHAGGRVLVPPGRAVQHVPRAGGQQPSARPGIARAARRAVRPRRRGARREPVRLQHLSRARAGRGTWSGRSGCSPTSPITMRPPSGRPSTCTATSPPTSRSSWSARPRWRRWRRWPPAASSCRASSSKRCRPGTTGPEPWRRTWSATSVRSPRRRSATPSSPASGAVPSWGSLVWNAPTTGCSWERTAHGASSSIALDGSSTRSRRSTRSRGGACS